MTASNYGAMSVDTEPGVFHHLVVIEGAGAADPTKRVGRTCSVIRSALGHYKVAWGSGPGYFVGYTHGFQATTPADLKGYTVVVGDFVAPTASAAAYIDVWVYDSTGNADDLEAGWKLTLDFAFRTVKG